MEITWQKIGAVISILLNLVGFGEWTGAIDILNPQDCEAVPEPADCPECEGPAYLGYTIAYVNNCQTGETDKYICPEGGKCKSTQKILSELG